MEPVEVATTMFAGGKGPNIILLLADELRADAVVGCQYSIRIWESGE